MNQGNKIFLKNSTDGSKIHHYFSVTQNVVFKVICPSNTNLKKFVTALVLNRFAAVEIFKQRGEPTTQQEENNKQQTDFTQKLFQGGKMHVALTANSFDF